MGARLFLWSSDGTPPAPASSDKRRRAAAVLHVARSPGRARRDRHDVVYFLAETPEAGVELWRSDSAATAPGWCATSIRDEGGFPRRYDNYGDRVIPV